MVCDAGNSFIFIWGVLVTLVFKILTIWEMFINCNKSLHAFDDSDLTEKEIMKSKLILEKFIAVESLYVLYTFHTID